jgi:putative tricarboxylic transport membrane protein
MSPLEGLQYGFSVALTPTNLIAALLGALLGTFVGVLPGLGPVGAVAILLSATLGLPPETALIALAAIFYGSMYGGSTTAILMNVPGETASVITAVEGYQLSRHGRAGAALAVAAVGSFVAGTLGILGLMLFAPPLAELALSFGPPEYFAIALLGLFALAGFSGGSFWKGLLVLAFGLSLATIGMDSVSGVLRYTFDVVQLAQGIEVVPVAIGLFGMAEVLLVAERLGGLPQVKRLRLRELLPSAAEWRRSVPAIFRGTGLGFLIGLIPGPAHILSTFASYRLERYLTRFPGQFGKGAIEGVAGPETANNAATSGAMVPLMALGLPFAPATALLLAALTMQGVVPGPLMIEERPEVFWGLVASMYVGNIALLVLNLPLIGVWVSLLRVPQPILLATILLFMVVGTYSVNNSLLDLLVLVVSGGVGYVLRKLQFDVAPIILAVVLGPMLEKTLQQTLFMSQGDLLVFMQRPISATLLAALVLLILFPATRSLWRRTSGYRPVPSRDV